VVEVQTDGNWPVLADDPTPSNPTTGTDLVAATFEDASKSIAAAIDGQCHAPGANYQATRPREITVEVIDARGNKATLGARLDVAISADGTPLNVVPPAAVRNGFVLGNLMANDSMAMWSRGPTSAPDYFALSGAGAAVQQCGTGLADTTKLQSQDHFSARLTAAAVPAVLSQHLIPVGNFGSMVGLREDPVDSNGDSLDGYNDGPCQGWLIGAVLAAAANRARLSLVDSASSGIFNSAYHPGDNNFHFLLAGPLNLTDSLSELVAQCRVETAGAAYFQCLTAILAPSTLPPHYVPGRVRLVEYVFPLIATPVAATGYGYFTPARPFQALALRADVVGAVPTGGTTLKLDLMTPVGGAFVSLFNTLPAFVASDRHLFAEIDSLVANYRRRTIRGSYAAGGAANLADNSVLRLDVNTRDSGNTATNVLVTVLGFEYDVPFNQFRIGSDLLEA
jgi:hypothetical protein